MVQFDNQYRQIKIKIVYYGPALGGKTTCLQHIHTATDPERRTKLYSLNTASDRTLFFDLLSLKLGKIRGYRLAIQLYTVPGQVQYNATRRAVLSGADGVVFVADSNVEQQQANIESLENLWDNLLANGIDKETVPLVLHYNKRDLPDVVSVKEMDKTLNQRRVPSFPSVALSGDGVLEGFAAISRKTLAAVADKLGVGGNPQAIKKLQEQVDLALEPFMKGEEEGQPAAAAEAQREVIHPSREVPLDEPLSQEVLVDEAVRANMAMTDLTAQLDATSQALEHKIKVFEEIAAFSRKITEEHDSANVLRLLIKTAVRLLRVHATAVLVVPGSGTLRAVAVQGIKQDPLLHAKDEAGEPLALGLTQDRQARVISAEQEGCEVLLGAVEAAGFASALVVPLISNDRLFGLLTTYAKAGRDALSEDELQLATVLAAAAGMGYDNAQAWQRLEDLNRELESQVADQTQQLRASLSEASRLAEELEKKNRLVEDAYRDLREVDQTKNELITRIANDMRTPVSSLQTSIDIVKRQQNLPKEKNERLLNIIGEEAQKLSEIIDTVLQASVLAKTRKSMEKEQVQLPGLFRNVIGPLRDLAKSRDIKIQVLTASGIDKLCCDAKTMEAALRAVVRNAIEYTSSGGEVKVEVRRANENNLPHLLVKVTDTGIGISSEDMASIFDSFYKGGDDNTFQTPGAGLGLAIAKRVIENHGGKILIDSKQGQGTQVTITVPNEL